MTARIEGKTYNIPEYWLLGIRQRGYTVYEAICWWHEQERLEQAFRAQQ